MSIPQRRILSSSAFVWALALVAPSGAGCGGSDSQPPTSTAAAVTGPADMHCIDNGVEINQAIGMCLVDDGGTTAALSADDGGADAASTDAAAAAADAGSSGVDTGGSDDGGAGDGDGGDDGGGTTSDYGPTLYNAEGDDDDCKYHVTWTSTAVKENVGVTFYVTAIRRADGEPATGADVVLEVYRTTTHPTPSLDIPNTESAGGKYKVGPVIFDEPGIWTVRFHFYETCSDEPADSPHGHAAFRVNVP
ncbi:MAG TPA: FixH family protein [Polyangia bacterium]|jgi:hypothetical protein